MNVKNKRRSLAILGSTGSVGCNVVDLARRNPDKFKVESLTANSNVKLLSEQAKILQPEYVAIADESHYKDLKSAFSDMPNIRLGAGAAAVTTAATGNSDMVIAAIVGAAGLESSFAAAKKGKMIALANKESLVCGGKILTSLAKENGAIILPMDSEHNAIFQCLDENERAHISRLILTASGGPFREFSKEQLKNVTVDEAIAHPNWSMGAKISVDSATLMNKGLELIEAHHLFDIPPEKIDIIIHPQSIIHSMVEYEDGSSLAQLGPPDMRVPIAHCLSWPKRMKTPVKKLDLLEISRLDFKAPDESRFPALRLAREALEIGGAAPTILNAANEVAVAAFLNKKITYTEICKIVMNVLENTDKGLQFASLEDILHIDALARRETHKYMSVSC